MKNSMESRFFQHFIATTEDVDVMLSKGIFLKAPQVDLDNEVEFVDGKKYLRGILGNTRSVNVAEISNLSRIIHRAQFSKMVFVTFNKLAKSKDVKQYFSKGRDGIQNVLDSLQEVLEKENIPISASSDYQLFNTEESPFSDKLLLDYYKTNLAGKKKKVALVSIMHKLINFIFAILRDQKEYELRSPQVHQKMLLENTSNSAA